MNGRWIALALMMMAALAVSSWAAEAPKVTLEANSMPIDEAMADVAKQAGVQIVCDTGVKGTVIGSFQAMELEKLLDTVTKVNNLKWQKLYLPAQADKKPTVDQIKARVEAVAAVTGGTIVVVDPATGKQKLFVEQDATKPSVEPDKLGLKPVYIVSKPKAEVKDPKQDELAKDAASKMRSLQDERMKLMAQMTPEQRMAAMQMEMLSMMNADPALRQQMMIAEMRARNEMDPNTREAYRDMMRDTFRTMREQGLIPEGAWGGRGGRRGPDDGPRGPQQ